MTEEKQFQVVTYDRGEEIEKGHWYRVSHWQSQSFLLMKTTWSKNWRVWNAEEEVEGVEEYQEAFVLLGDSPDFRAFLLRGIDCIRVMCSATYRGKKVFETLGWLSRETVEALMGEDDIDARPQAVFLPHGNQRYRLRVTILTRSLAYRRRKAKNDATG